MVRSLLANCHQGCVEFQPYNGVQCTAIALVALLMFVKHMPDLSELSPSDLNQTVANGTHFYGHILSSGREYGYLSHRDLPPTFYSWNGLPGEIEYFFDRYYGVVNGVVNVDAGEMSFEHAFLEANGITSFHLVTFGGNTVAVYSNICDNTVYVFDSHQRDSLGFPNENGNAVMLQFENFEEFFQYVTTLFSNMRYEITPLLFPWYNFDCSTIATSSRSSFLSNEDKVINLCEEQKERQYGYACNKTNSDFSSFSSTCSSNKNFHTYCKSSEKICSIKKKKRKQVAHEVHVPQNYFHENVSFENSERSAHNLILKDLNSSGGSINSFDNVSCFFTISDHSDAYPTRLDINYLHDENHVQAYESRIRECPIFSCACCDRFLFQNQTHSFKNAELKNFTHITTNGSDVLCQTCHSLIKKKEVPYLCMEANCLKTFEIPSELRTLSLIEKRLIALIQIFMTVIILPGGQMAEKGLILNLPTNVQVIANQLPEGINDGCFFAVNFEHKGYVESEKFKYFVSPQKVKKALLWLKRNNLLYEHIAISEENEELLTDTEMDFQDFDMESATLTPINSTMPNDISVIGNEGIINVPHISEKPVRVYEMESGEEMAFPWLFPYGKNGLNYNRPMKISKSMYFKYRLYNKNGNFRKDLTYLLHSAVSYDLACLKSEININMRIKKGQNNAVSVNACDIKNLQNNAELKENSYMFVKNIRGTVAYFRNQLYNLLAMFRCLGPPTLFMTLSADDLHWPELGMMLHNIDFDEAKQWNSFGSGMRSDPLMTAIHFERRFKSLMKYVIQSEKYPLGKVLDYFARVEFQNRGSPHIHMFLWIEDVPNEISNLTIPTLVRYIDKTICSVIPNCEHDAELFQLVTTLQSHSHTSYCSKGFKSCCRFGFPKRECEKTFVVGNINLSDKNKGKFYTTKRTSKDVMINSYNPDILRHWRANMDIQMICNAEGAAYYVCSYICKSEPDELKNALGQLIHNVFRENPIPRHERLLKIGLTVLRHRRLSSQEAAYRLSNLNLIHVTRCFVYLNTRQPSKRYRILKSRKEIEILDDNSTEVFQTNIIDYYHCRPVELSDICLFKFCSWYKKCSNEMPKRVSLSRIYIEKYDVVMKKCKKPSVVRFPHFPPSSDDHFYSMLLLLLPHKSENELVVPYSNLREAFINKRQLFNTSIDFINFSFTEQIENTIRKLKLMSELSCNSSSENTKNDTLFSLNNDLVLEKLFFADVNESASLNTSKNATEIFDDDLHMHSFSCSMSIVEFRESVKRLTPSQLEAFCFVKSKFEKNELPFHLFLTGGAGVGKTFTTKVIIAYIQLFCARVLNSNCVLVCAPTGTAANNINGRTIHSLLRVPVAQFLNYAGLSSYTLKQVRKEFENVHSVVIDEVSMVSGDMLTFISRRLSEIKDCDLPFGGCNIIAVGDFFQLRPVKGNFAFKNELLWHLFQPMFLKENNRQNSDLSYYFLLNRVRIGMPLENDISFLKSRLQYDETKFSKFLHIYPTRQQVEMYNNNQLSKLANTITKSITNTFVVYTYILIIPYWT